MTGLMARHFPLLNYYEYNKIKGNVNHKSAFSLGLGQRSNSIINSVLLDLVFLATKALIFRAVPLLLQFSIIHCFFLISV
jgi:hypothetical protein